MKRLVISPAARADLLEIATYIADDNPLRAVSFVSELEAKAQLTAERPNSFPSREALGAGLRSASHGRYLIFFRDFSDYVKIVRVLHSARNLTATNYD
jgi:toxin ParE1/3/4